MTPPVSARIEVVVSPSGAWVGYWRWSTEDGDFCLSDYAVVLPLETAEKLADQALFADQEKIRELEEKMSRLKKDVEELRNATHPQ